MSYHIFDETSLGNFVKMLSDKAKYGLRFEESTNTLYLEKQGADDHVVINGTGGGTTIVQVPSVTVGTYSYTGGAQGPTISNLADIQDNVTITNQTKTDAGSYTMTIALKNSKNMVWSDMTTASKTWDYSISKVDGYTGFGADSMVDLSDTSAPVKTFTGTGATGALSVTSSNETACTASLEGNTLTITSLNKGGSSTVTVTSAATVNYNAATTTFSVTCGIVTAVAPSVTVGTYTYNGEAQGPTVGTYDSSLIDVTGATHTDAGSYTLTVALKDPTSSVWSTGGNANKTYDYKINKADGTLTLSKTSVTFSGSTTSTTVTASGYQGSLNVSSNKTSVATASVSGSTITINSVNKTSGSAIITVTSAATTNYNSASKTISVTCNFLKIVTWANGTDAEIKAMVDAADAGQIKLSDYWAVGDTRNVNLSAMSATNVGESHVAQTVQMTLMNQGGVTLTTGKTCSFVVGLKDCLNETGYMNSSDTNSGSWDGCARRKWCNNEFYNAVPSSLRGIFKKFNCITAETYNGSVLKTSQDYFALPAEREVFGPGYGYSGSGYSNNTEAASTKLVYWTWYQTTSNRVKKKGGSTYWWWERSPGSGDSHFFCFVYSDGGAGSGYASYADGGLAPFGCI